MKDTLVLGFGTIIVMSVIVYAYMKFQEMRGGPPAIGPDNRPSISTVPGASDTYRNLLFVDQTLDDLYYNYNIKSAKPGGWDYLFLTAHDAFHKGQADVARKNLRDVLVHPQAELRARLWAWNSLRQLGDLPTPQEGRVVQGIVFEVPVQDWVDTLAIYADGRVRYVNSKFGPASAIVWEAPGSNATIDSLILRIITGAAPFVDTGTLQPVHKPLDRTKTRANILTYNGMYIVEPANSNELSAILSPATELFVALINMTRASRKTA